MNDDIAINVDSVSKNFALPHEKTNSLKSTFLQRVKGGKRSLEVQHALKDVSFEIKKGEFFGIVGRNGSGKSTLLKILAEIYKPTDGNIQISGRLVPFIELGVGFNPDLSGRDNVYLSASLLGFSRREINAMYEDIVAFAELEKFMDQKLKNYSSGMQVRLAFSIATRVNGDILLIDEVLAVGDADFQRKCFNYFKHLKRLRKTVVFVSHDMSAIAEFCDRGVLINNSEIIKVGGAVSISEEYSKLFLDDVSVSSSNVRSVDTPDRYGNKDVKIDNVVIEPTTLKDDGAELKISVSHTAMKDVENIAFGVSVLDATGHPICGTNTRVKRMKIAGLKKGEKCGVEWVMPNIFADGQHTVTVAVHSTDGVTMYDWWPDAASFTVRKVEKTAFKVSPLITVSVS